MAKHIPDFLWCRWQSIRLNLSLHPRSLIDKLLKENKNIILVGGTGLYLKATLFDYNFTEGTTYKEYNDLTNEEILAKIKSYNIEELPHVNNRKRLVRLLNKLENNETITNNGNNLLYKDTIFIGLTTNRDVLYDKINKRVDIMFDNGLLEEIESLKALELEEGSLLWHTRNCFMLAFYCAGMRAGDLIQLRGTNVVYENGGWRISYRMDKTATAKEILLLPEALEIITEYIDLQNRTSKYIFPLLDNNAPYAKAVTWESKEQLPYEIKKMLLQHTNSKNSLLNKYLGKLAAMAGIEKKVSMHCLRHIESSSLLKMNGLQRFVA